MRFHVVSLFPELFDSWRGAGIIGKAHDRGQVEVLFQNPRDFTHDKHRSVDDTPYGGGSGMVMMPGPVVEALEALSTADEARPHRILLTPQGKRFGQADAQRLAGLPAIALVCGRYEGFDERIRPHVDEEFSLGDFVLLGGEVPAMAMIEAVARLLPGVLGNQASAEDESHVAGLLEYPQYTRPAEFRGASVPEVLRSGDHAAIARYRRRESLRRTKMRRPELLDTAPLTKEDRAMLAELDQEEREDPS